MSKVAIWVWCVNVLSHNADHTFSTYCLSCLLFILFIVCFVQRLCFIWPICLSLFLFLSWSKSQTQMPINLVMQWIDASPYSPHCAGSWRNSSEHVRSQTRAAEQSLRGYVSMQVQWGAVARRHPGGMLIILINDTLSHWTLRRGTAAREKQTVSGSSLWFVPSPFRKHGGGISLTVLTPL